MPKYASIGNGRLLIGFNSFGLVKELYFHYPGLENHIGKEFVHKVGVVVEDRFSWLDGGDWEIEVKTRDSTMATNIVASNKDLGLQLDFCDVVYNEKDIFIREVVVKNLFNRKRQLKIYFNQQFNISQTHIGDTSFYDPRDEVVIHYKGRRVFLINAKSEDGNFSSYSVGLIGIENRDGTFKDAEDGILSQNAIEHGQVDSLIELPLSLKSKGESTFYYWMTIAKSIKKAKELNQYISSRGAGDIVKTTKDYWKAWVKHQNFTFWSLSEEAINLFEKSLINIRTHVARNGAIIASGDSDLFQFGRDTYAYVWPRDAAFTAIALERAGDFNASRRFFEFASKVITNEGYFMHKYRPDMALGSSWHPWVRNGQKQFPIQEDETALVITALYKHYELSKDIEFIEQVYNDLIKSAAEFMVSYRDGRTGLPGASYDLWERDYGISTFTSSAVYGALTAASKFARMFGKEESYKKYEGAANDIKKAIIKYLYDEGEGFFIKQIRKDEGSDFIDKTIDFSSVYGVYRFGVLDINDKKLEKAFKSSVDRLSVNTEIGGIARFEGDTYYSKGGNVSGNPWVITTMWLAQYYIDLATKESDLKKVNDLINWVVKLAKIDGVLPEQFDPYTGEYLSAAPLTWSHAEFVTTIILYLEKAEKLGICKACYPIT